MDFTGKLQGILVLLVTFDARKVMKQYHQTMWAVRVANLRKISHSPRSITPVGISEGHDHNEDLVGHDRQCEFISKILALIDRRISLKDPDGTPLDVHVFVSADGAARREGGGTTSAASTYPSEYNHVLNIQVQQVNEFTPITLNNEFVEEHQPKDPGKSRKSRIADAKKSFGVFGPNFTQQDMEKFVPEVLHQLLLVMNRLMLFTIRACVYDVNTDLDTVLRHCRECLGIHHDFYFIEKDGRSIVGLKGNPCKKLRHQSHQVVNCEKHSIMTDECQRFAITAVWRAFEILLDDNANTDPGKSMSASDYFLAAHKAMVISAAVFGRAFITPTIRSMRDQNPYFKKFLLDKYGLLLADFDMEAAEAENKVQKNMFLRGLKAGGTAGAHEPMRKLLVRGCVR